MPKLEAASVDFVDSAPVIVSVGRTIHASPEAIWAALTDNASWTAWFPDMKRCETTSSPGDGLGSTRTVKVGSLVADEQFIFWERPRDWGFTITKTNLPMASKMIERVELGRSELGPDSASSDAVTEVRYHAYLTPHVLVRPFAKLVTAQIRRAWEQGLVGLAAHVEA